MQDRFKFRVWHKKRKKMYDVLHFHARTWNNDGEWVTAKGFNIITQQDIHVQIEPKDCVIMQCTGLKDKYDKLIYEGDIVKGTCGVYWGLMVVEYLENRASFVYRRLDGKYYFLSMLGECNFEELLGNVYENPELLKEY